ncbi:hypothetical protein NDU88_007408 [Pleurodeles waltl]|uniref:Uncharacterized protein n=1 Tax=Pleurodeles waltl TaxID=8319 RepID=A0AAV7NWK8_PLEWA|nr:hypothetical protein NDU88_007408 [Pleurodeles waltl]
MDPGPRDRHQLLPPAQILRRPPGDPLQGTPDPGNTSRRMTGPPDSGSPGSTPCPPHRPTPTHWLPPDLPSARPAPQSTNLSGRPQHLQPSYSGPPGQPPPPQDQLSAVTNVTAIPVAEPLLCRLSGLSSCPGPRRGPPVVVPMSTSPLFLLTSGGVKTPSPRRHRGLRSGPGPQRGHSLQSPGPGRLECQEPLTVATSRFGRQRHSPGVPPVGLSPTPEGDQPTPPSQSSDSDHESGRHGLHPPPRRLLTRPRATTRTTGCSPEGRNTALLPRCRTRHRLQSQRATPPIRDAPSPV